MSRISIDGVKKQIDHKCDGPITSFVIISRGCEILEKNDRAPAEDVANAIHELLVEYDYIEEAPD